MYNVQIYEFSGLYNQWLLNNIRHSIICMYLTIVIERIPQQSPFSTLSFITTPPLFYNVDFVVSLSILFINFTFSYGIHYMMCLC